MSTAAQSPPAMAVLNPAGLAELIDVLRGRGYSVVAPTVRDGAVVYDEIASSSELPAGWTDEQEAGTYRLKPRGDAAVFGYAVGPHSWKRYLHPPLLRLWQAKREGDGFAIVPEKPAPTKFAFLGVRACELAAIAVQDRTFLQGTYGDPIYKQRRESAFIVAVNCSQAGGTCFCVSMNTGPKASAGFDLALTEVIGDGRHEFVVEVGSPAGVEVLASLRSRPAAEEDASRARSVSDRCARSMGRTMDTAGIRELLQGNLEHPRWKDVADRCLSCGNCTMVCPTCFCTTVEDVTDLAGETAERNRRWDSCFTADFTHMAGGGSVRSSTLSRYRQWMTHKLSTWWDQFRTSGCTGCGRCITWCPVGIDITEEVKAIRATDAAIEV